ncbi:S8 family serine peptidase [Deinococcus sp.]|uniref:S8 family serine peptidase n=1 Tax=Deinococcus sp. TaxID=47478 RepID=UPI003B592AD6
MKHLLLAALLLGLGACAPSTPPTTTPPGEGGGIDPNAPGTLGDAEVALGGELSAVYQAPFNGNWQLSDLPAWLSASPISGEGKVLTTLTINRAAAAPSSADLPRLSADLKLIWTGAAPAPGADGSAGRAASGEAALSISADLYHLSGQVSTAAKLANALPPVALRNSAQSSPARGIIVKYKTDAALSAAMLALPKSLSPTAPQAQAASNSQTLQARSGRVLTLRAAGSEAQMQAALAALRADPQVEYAVPNRLLRAQSLPPSAQPTVSPPVTQQPYLPADEYAPLQYAYRLMGYGAVWREMQTAPYSKAVTVAVLDSGVRFDHPDLAGRLWRSGEGALDVVASDDSGPDTDPTDPGETLNPEAGSHGTHVTGIIVAGQGTFTPACPACTGSGVVGAALTAPIKVLPVRVIPESGSATVSDVALGIDYASGQPITLTDSRSGQAVITTYTNPHPAQIINLSLGAEISASDAQPLCDAVAAASQKGVLVVVSAGNGGGKALYYPAACPGAVSVASVRPDVGGLPTHAEYSQHNPQVAISAYGGADPFGNPTYNMNLMLNGQAVADSIFSTSWDYEKNQPNYQFESGTSQAAPQVSALAALLLSKGVVATPQAALARMQATATDLGSAGRDEYTGSGVINAAAALGAPVVSSSFTFSVLGIASSYAPPLDEAGRFSAYLPDGDFQVLAGFDQNDNSLGGEIGEPGAKKSVTLGPGKLEVNLGSLQVGP